MLVFTFKIQNCFGTQCSGKGFPPSMAVNNPPTDAGDVSSIPESGRTPAKGNSNQLQYSCLGIPKDYSVGYSPWGRKNVGHDLANKQQQVFIEFRLLFHVQNGCTFTLS